MLLSTLRPATLGGFLAASALCLGACATPSAPSSGDTALRRIGHVVVIYAENHSFDNLYGLFPGADGIAQATPEQRLQRDHDGSVLPELVVFGRDGRPDPAYPRLPNAPFRIDAPPVNRRLDDMVPSPTHAFFHHREQIAGGRNDRFAALSNAGGWVMGHYDGSQMKLWQWAPRVHAGRQVLHGRVRGLLPEPPLPDLRLRAAPRGGPGRHARGARRPGPAATQARARPRPPRVRCKW